LPTHSSTWSQPSMGMKSLCTVAILVPAAS
jgi:hypothetical protein